ncbi:MAG: hypothetical protein KBA51_04145 [Kiritimatiellae bacterium]|nr:hypothetical protein [Kiritimatiellia bacterium]
MNPWFRRMRWFRVIAAAGLACVAAVGAGCDDGRPNVDDPPEGLGRLVIDNRSTERVHVYLDGEPAGDVGSGKHRAFDFQPGEVRVTLDQSHSDRIAQFEVDILRDRILIAEVADDYSYTRLDVFVYLD